MTIKLDPAADTGEAIGSRISHYKLLQRWAKAAEAWSTWPNRMNQSALILRQNLLDDASMHIGQPAINAAMAKGELLMIDAEQMQNGRMEVVARRDTLDGFP